MKFKPTFTPIFKGFNHKGIRISIAEKDVELLHRKIKERNKNVESKGKSVNQFHLNTPLADATLFTTWDKKGSKKKQDGPLPFDFNIDTKGATVGNLDLSWDFKKNKK